MNAAHHLAAFALTAIAFAGIATAAEPKIGVVIQNYRFEPAELKVPAGLLFGPTDGAPRRTFRLQAEYEL